MFKILSIHIVNAEREDGSTILAKFSVNVGDLVCLNGLRLVRTADGEITITSSRQESRRYGSIRFIKASRSAAIEAVLQAYNALRDQRGFHALGPDGQCLPKPQSAFQS